MWLHVSCAFRKNVQFEAEFIIPKLLRHNMALTYIVLCIYVKKLFWPKNMYGLVVWVLTLKKPKDTI